MTCLSNDSLAVPYCPDYIIEALDFPHERDFARGLNAWLDEQVLQIEMSCSGSYTIERIPMLPPKHLRECSLSPLGYSAQFLSSANCILLDGMAHIPYFETHIMTNYSDLAERFRNETETVLERYGYKLNFVEAGKMLRHSGLFHCLTGRLAIP